MSFSSLHSYKIVSNKRVRYADKRSIESGVYEYDLIRNASESVVETIIEEFPACFRVDILCGPGNNGGDGYFIAQLLRDKKFRVTVYAVDQYNDCSAHSTHAAKDYKGTVKSLTQFIPDKDVLIVDALFGSGLKRPLEDVFSETVDKINNGEKAGVVSVDIPSGISGDTGEVLGTAVQASHTVTFERLRYGHVLFPGHAHCGVVSVKPIGVNEIFLDKNNDDDEQEVILNHKEFYHSKLPRPNPYLHKYTRGYVNIIAGGITFTGAAHLSACGAARMGIGIIRIGAPNRALEALALKQTSSVPYILEEKNHLISELGHDHLGCMVFGPGGGTDRRAELMMDILLDHISQNPDFKIVFDADALTILSTRDIESLSLNSNVILTPHEGEFERIFPHLMSYDKLQRTKLASREINATIILKGPDTLIASPDGRCVVQTRPLFNLATAGSGDILSGMVAGLIARKMPSFEAACAAIYLHAEAAKKAPLYATADELVKCIALPSLKYDYSC